MEGRMLVRKIDADINDLPESVLAVTDDPVDVLEPEPEDVRLKVLGEAMRRLFMWVFKGRGAKGIGLRACAVVYVVCPDVLDGWG